MIDCSLGLRWDQPVKSHSQTNQFLTSLTVEHFLSLVILINTVDKHLLQSLKYRAKISFFDVDTFLF